MPKTKRIGRKIWDRRDESERPNEWETRTSSGKTLLVFSADEEGLMWLYSLGDGTPISLGTGMLEDAMVEALRKTN